MTIDQGVALAMKIMKILAASLLLIFITLTLLKLLGFNFFPVGSAGFQELGVFIAGAAFALSKL